MVWSRCPNTATAAQAEERDAVLLPLQQRPCRFQLLDGKPSVQERRFATLDLPTAYARSVGKPAGRNPVVRQVWTTVHDMAGFNNMTRVVGDEGVRVRADDQRQFVVVGMPALQEHWTAVPDAVRELGGARWLAASPGFSAEAMLELLGELRATASHRKNLP